MFRWSEALFRLPRRQKRLIQLSVDAGLIVSSFMLAMLLRLDSWDFIYNPMNWLVLSTVIPVSLFIFVRLGFYRAVIRYLSHKALQAITVGVATSSLSLGVLNYLFGLPVPRSVPFIYAILAVLLVGGVRFVMREIYMGRQMRHKTRVLVYGAGAAGRQLAASLDQGREHQPIAFVDDSPQLKNVSIQGLNVHPPGMLPTLIQTYGIEKILLAIPSANRMRRREILAHLESLEVPVQTMPGLADVLSGKSKVSEICDVSVEDLLGRDPTPPDASLMGARISGKVVMVTGAGGSIGSELCRQILRQNPRQLLLFELSEYGLYSIEQELKQIAEREGLRVSVKALLGSVQHGRRLQALMTKFGVQTIYHAAAYKHVPMVEDNVIEGVRNNVFGTVRAAQAAVAAGVETFVLISTDKAVRPTNVMGATKRMAELVCQALADAQNGTRFSMVRFGNVLGSSGSVVPLFRRQIQAGGPVTVTHPSITRYFMTIPEAAQLVIQAGSMARGGDVFVLDMGEPVKIAELAKHMIRLSGLEPISASTPSESANHGDIEIIYTGLRPGEKLYEELLVGEKVEQTRHERIMTAHEIYWPWEPIERLLNELLEACRAYEPDRVRRLLVEAPLAYSPRVGGNGKITTVGEIAEQPLNAPLALKSVQ